MLFILKKRITPIEAKIFSTLGVSSLVMLLVFFLMSGIMKRSQENFEKQYIESCNYVVQGYSSAIQYYLENYHTSLSSIFNEELFASGDKDAIRKWIMDNKIFVHNDFCVTFYIDENSIGYFSQGLVTPLLNREYVSPDNFKDSDYYVSDLIHSEFTPEPIFIMEKPFFDKNHELKGVLCASVKFTTLAKFSDEIKIGEGCTAYLQDRKGRLLDHPENEYFGKIFTPENEKYKHLSSDKTSSSESDGIIEVENYLGEPIDLIYTKIKNCGWTLAVGFPKKYSDKIYSQLRLTKMLILLIAIISLLFLLLLEILISDYFYKNQLVEVVYDPLTKLWSRQKFEKEAVKIMNRNPKSRFMLIDSDIRGFKFINQNYGEETADKMILFYSNLLNRIVNDYNGIIGHGYADRFYIFLKIQNIRLAIYELKNRMDELNESIKTYDIPFFPKFGVTFCKLPKNIGISVKELMGQASFAKSLIKDNMIVPYSIYNISLLDKVREEQYIEHHMESALENKEFFVMYQPKISLSNDKIAGAEALVRWKTADAKIFSPDKFIPLFERNGFIIKLDFYVYDLVFKFLETQIKLGNSVVPISVNMSRNHSKPDKFMNEFMTLFRKYDIPPSLIQLEIIERSFMDSATLYEITNRLHEEGFSVAMDDFGSGESSLNMLTKVPVDVLKFDREFLDSATNPDGEIDEKSLKFIQSLLELSKHLEKKTVFEGVETESQRNFLKSINCDQVQGYFYSRPLFENDFIEFVKNHI